MCDCSIKGGVVMCDCLMKGGVVMCDCLIKECQHILEKRNKRTNDVGGK
jgi:hypothetical protein